MPRRKKEELQEIQEEIKETIQTQKVMMCGHEEIPHAVDCKACWEGKRFCGLKWFRCGGHGPHVETDCEKLCMR